MGTSMIKLCMEYNMIISKEYYIKLIEEIIEEYDIEFNEIGFENDKTLLGSYYPKSNVLKVNYNKIISSDLPNKSKNIELVKTMFHELMHYVQIKEILAKDNDNIKEAFSCYYDLMQKGLEDDSLNNSLYNYCHDNYIFEYQANLLSLLRSAEFFEKLGLDNVANKLYIDGAKFVLKEYKDDFCPITKNLFTFNYANALINNETDNSFKDCASDDEYCRLIFGYSLSDNSLNYIKNVANKKEDAIQFQKKL